MYINPACHFWMPYSVGVHWPVKTVFLAVEEAICVLDLDIEFGKTILNE
jgi:hypothetical protein